MLAIIIVLVEYKPSEKKIIHSLWTIYYLCTFDHLQRKMKVGLGSLTEEKYPFQNMIDQFNRRDLYCHINIFTPLYFSLHALIYHRRMFIKYVTSVIFQL